MFSKKQEAAINYEALLGPDFLNFLERVEELEDETAGISRETGIRDLRFDSDASFLKREIYSMDAEIKRAKEKIYIIKKNFTLLVSEFKLRSSQEDFMKLKKRVDNWEVDKFISRKEFERLLNESLTD